MSQGANRILDEFARLATDAVGAAQAERLLRDMDVATREEVAVLRDLVSALREENERLSARVTALEAGAKPAAGPASA
jgi:BMFP domain-containing protein YqiC